MRRSIASVLLLAAISVTAACGARQQNHIRVDDVALGRVVVYRNGVAFYERRAIVKGGRLTVVVPRDRVDDFLKSLTVADAKTKKPLPVSFPREQADMGMPYIEMSLEVPTDEAEVVLTYVTEAPAWKPTYRLVVDEDAKKVLLQAWAIVDNTSGEDWNDVILGVGSSSAMSFKYDLWSIKTVARETLHSDVSFAVAPPTAQSSYAQVPQGAENVVANFDDAEIRRPEGHPEHVDEATRVAATQPAPPPADYGGEASVDPEAAYGGYTATESADVVYEDEAPKKGKRGKGKRKKEKKRTRTAAADPNTIVVGQSTTPPPVRDTRASEGDAKVKQLADYANSNNQTIVIEGYADPNEADDQRSLDRANMVRNQLIDQGVPPARVKVVNKGYVAGTPAGVKVVTENADGTTAATSTYAEADAPPVGEGHFVSKTPMTVLKGHSVMASMMQKETDGEIAYLYDAESARGNDKYAFRAVRLDNPTKWTLEAGPVEVYGEGKMIGEGLTESIPPHSSVVIPYALDRQVVVEREDNTDNQVSRLVTLQRGILTAEVQHIRRTRLTITSRLRTDTKVYVRHTVEKGWSLIESPDSFEKIAEAHLFEIPVAAGKTQVIEIAEATPMTRTLDLQADVTLQMMKVFLETNELSKELEADVESLLAIHKEMIDGKEKLDSLRRRLAEYRVRMDELHGQIVTLKAVKSGGELMKHLQAKMKDISNRVQKTTIEVVDTDEKIMLAKVRFQDALSELTLPDAMGAPAGGGGTPAVSVSAEGATNSAP